MPDLPPHERQALGDTIRLLRAERRLTQEEVAEAAGVSRKYVSDLERGAHRPSFDGIVLLTRAFGITLAEFGRLFDERTGRTS